MSGPGKHRGTHALRKRCPVCRKRRRFYEPPEDVTGVKPRVSRYGWTKRGGRWICKRCFLERGDE